jgi:tetratricopeptide (TPR) repeat protein
MWSLLNKGRGRQLGWISAVVLVSIAVISAVFLHFNRRDVNNGYDPADRLAIKARCAIASGRGLAADSVTIACGLDKAEIEAVIRRAVAEFNLEALVEQVRKGKIEDPTTIDALGQMLGLTREAVMRLLAMFGDEQFAQEPLVDRFAELAGRGAAVVGEAPRPDSGKETPPANNGSDVADGQGSAGGPASPGQQRVLKEAEVLQAECAAVARGNVTVGTVDIRCGAEQSDIEAIIARVVSEADLARFLEQLRRGGVPNDAVIQALARELRLTHTNVLRLLTILAGTDVPPEQTAERLAGLAERHHSLVWRIAQLHSDDPIIGALRDQAAEAIAQGDYPRAEALLAKAEVELAEGRREPHPLTKAAQSAARGETLLAEGNYLAAAEQFAEAAILAPDEAQLVRMAYLARQAQALVSHGDERGDNDALARAVEVYSIAFGPLPLTGVRMLNALGSTLRILGERKLGSRALERAIDVHRSALGWLDRRDAPLVWAWTQSYLGTALWRLGERERGTRRLEEAVEAFRSALEEQTRERVPFDWAQTQHSLGIALHSLGERETSANRLEATLEAYGAAIIVYTREAAPFEWALVQNNRGNALLVIGEREGNTARIQEAVAAYRAALEEFPRERVPLDWAMVQHNLGNAILALGERESNAARLEQAREAYRAALEERTRERMPLGWAQTQANLGNALLALGERQNSRDRIEEAVAAYSAALEERTRESVPLDWAETQSNLGVALWQLGKRESSTARLQQAVDAFRFALLEYSPDLMPLDRARSQSYLGETLQLLGEREGRIEPLQEALDALQGSLEVYQKAGMTQRATDLAKKLATVRTRIAAAEGH